MKRRYFLRTALFGTIAIHLGLRGKEKLKTTQIDDSFFAKREDTIFTWLGMAGALINCRGTIIFIDPLISYGVDNKTCETGDRLLVPLPVTADKVPRADLVCYTHADGDHYAEKTASVLNSRLSPRFLAPGPVFEKLNKLGIESSHLIEIKDFASYFFGDVEIVITPALHDWQKVDPWKREDCCGYLIKTPDDSLPYVKDLKAVFLKPDPGEILKLPINPEK